MTEMPQNPFAGRSDDWRAGYEAGITAFQAELTGARDKGLIVERRDMPKWQTIETAPDDGQIIVVFGGRYTKPDIVKADGEWWRVMKAVHESQTVPTYWHPLPEPPAAGK